MNQIFWCFNHLFLDVFAFYREWCYQPTMNVLVTKNLKYSPGTITPNLKIWMWYCLLSQAVAWPNYDVPGLLTIFITLEKYFCVDNRLVATSENHMQVLERDIRKYLQLRDSLFCRWIERKMITGELWSAFHTCSKTRQFSCTTWSLH